jgi:hypothetical protein
VTSTGERDLTHPVTALVRAAKEGLDALVETPLWSLDAADTEALVADLATLEARLAELQARVIAHAEDLHLPASRGTGTPPSGSRSPPT